MLVRDAEKRDLAAIAAVYDHEVQTSTATFDAVSPTMEQHAAWLARHGEPRYPVLVAELEGVVCGWASLSPWSERCAYARAAEVSVYVHRDHRGRGVGRALLGELVARARAAGLGVLLARIVSDGAASRALHESLGFQHIGTMRRVGEKFGRVLDVDLFDLQLDETSRS